MRFGVFKIGRNVAHKMFRKVTRLAALTQGEGEAHSACQRRFFFYFLACGKEFAIGNGITMDDKQDSAGQTGWHRVILPEFAGYWRFFYIGLKPRGLF
jgi:hypothetical protein